MPKACTPGELLDEADVRIILNLTVPKAHTEVNLAAVEAGKHVYCEKPLAVTCDDGRRTLEAAAAKGVRVGCAPDTFLGGAAQTCRKIIDDGVIGEPVAAVAFMACRGHEHWHPAPEFYYEKGGGPMFDMGPYYLTALVNLIGPVRRVTGSARITFAERTITSEANFGRKIEVRTPTHIAGVLDFHNGAIGSVLMSFDVHAHHLPMLEVYGTTGSLSVPDPNSFGGVVKMRLEGDKNWREVPPTHSNAVSRGIGLADMACAIQSGRPHRASGELAYHVLEVMQAFEESSDTGKPVEIQSACARPAALPEGLKPGELDA